MVHLASEEDNTDFEAHREEVQVPEVPPELIGQDQPKNPDVDLLLLPDHLRLPDMVEPL